MPTELAVTKAVVTGGAQGIGAAIARRLAADGAAVAIVDLQEEKAVQTAADIADQTGAACYAFGCDMAERSHVAGVFAEAAEAMGGLDCYVGNAGITRDRMLHRLSDDDWDEVIAVNLTGVYAGLKAASPWLRTEAPGRVVLISSIVANTGNLGQINYTAAKAGVVGLVRTAALELARFNTTVNGVRPGYIQTAMTAAMPLEAQTRLTENPLGRVGQPEDIAGAAAYLCSTDAGFVTGQFIDVNGGADFA